MRLVPIGKIVACHGLRGIVRMVCFNAPPTPRVLDAEVFYLQRPGAPPHPRAVESVRQWRAHAHVKFQGLDSRTAAQDVVGMVASVPEEALPAPGPQEFYYHEILGFAVRTTDGRSIGTVLETFDTGSNDVLVVKDGPHQHLIPVIADVVRAIDRTDRVIVIEPLEGLLDS